jgi:2'-5' RNA ligase
VEGLVSLLDPKHDALTRALWDELEATLGLRGVWATPYPHFSYQIAPSYAAAAVETASRALALSAAPFTVQTSGVAVFTGLAPVVYLPVVRTAQLSAWHAQVWAAGLPAAREPVPYYHPDHWVPHITLAQGGLSLALAAEAVGLLAGRDLNWTLRVDNLSFIGLDEEQQKLRWRLPLGEAARSASNLI